ncbi:cytochrome ubiquinol oxidase subunit I [Pedobacter sp. 22163]|uniref:cytochrome ubiquinol oxidase subunit I n=1 Tax=Pedobacter sp. 22163 TaxID=3453883 RepID=UPI003F86E4D9
MTDLISARSQMALSLGFHIVFSCIGMAMPFFMAVSHWIWLKKKDPVYELLTRAWAKGVAIFFTTGAVSGTVLSFELGLLWPEFMKHAGPIFGLPFSMEGAAFFVEAIAMGFFAYGWGRFNKWFHWATGVVVGVSGVVSGILVVSANSWMNAPSGFVYRNGIFSNIDPIKAMFNQAWFSQALHMTVAAFAATGFAVAGVHAFLLLRKRSVELHKRAFKIAATFGLVASLIQPLSGDISARGAAKRQPAKLAAMEVHYKTGPSAPLVIGGIYDAKTQKLKGAIELPGMLSFLAHHDFKAEVIGLDKFAPKDRPPVAILHYAFQIMVALGMLMLGASLLFMLANFKFRRWMGRRWFLLMYAIMTPAGFLAVEAGWTVTEVGRQPWIIQGIMRTADAVNPMPGIQFSFYLFTVVYVSLSCMVVSMLYRQIQSLDASYEAN